MIWPVVSDSVALRLPLTATVDVTPSRAPLPPNILINFPTAPPSWNLTRWSERMSAETTAEAEAMNKTAHRQTARRRISIPPRGSYNVWLVLMQQSRGRQYFIFADEKEFLEWGRVRNR